ncbi:MAG: response regulator [Rhodospirillales bacterium]
MVTILVIDDEEMFRRLLSKLIENAGHAAVQAADGATGLSLARDTVPDLIVTDMSMPGMTGFELIRALRRDPATKDIPVVVASAHETAEDRDEAFEAGCDDYIEKAVSPEKLIAQVLGALP